MPNGLRKGGIAIYVNVLDQCNGVVYSCNVSVILVCGVHALKMLGVNLMTELSGSRKAADALKLEATTDQSPYQSPVSMFVLISKAIY